jgi:hypothetical protein
MDLIVQKGFFVSGKKKVQLPAAKCMTSSRKKQLIFYLVRLRKQ